MMTKDFDPILEFPCHSEEFGEGVFTVSFIIILAVSFSNFSFQTLSSSLIMLNHERPISLQIIYHTPLQKTIEGMSGIKP